MGEILGLGCTHYPGLTVPDERLPAGFHRLLTAPGVPAYYKDPANWPAELVTELGNGPSVMLWSFLSTAGGEGGLWRCVPLGSGTRTVDMV